MIFTIYNICGIYQNRENLDYYINALESILAQQRVEQKIIVSGCMSSSFIKQELYKHFTNKISYFFIDEILPLNITYNKCAQLCVEKWGVPQAFGYIDSGVTLLDDKTLLNLWRKLMITTDCGMITTNATSDNGFPPWLGFQEPPTNLYKVPVGKACHPHCHLFANEIYTEYNNRLWPDIFASFCTESTWTFLCAAIKRSWYILNILVNHSHELEGGSSGFRHEQEKAKRRQNDGKGVWDHNFRTKRTMREIIDDPVGIAAGFGYEEIQNILIHDHNQFDENGWCKNKVLKEFLKNNLYLKQDEFDYNNIKHEFITSL